MAKKIGSETVTVIRQAKVDPLDDDGSGAASVEHDVEGCAVVPRAAHDENKGWTNVEGYLVAMPYDADITEKDSVRCRGRVYDVDGVPARFTNKRGFGKACLVNLERRGS